MRIGQDTLYRTITTDVFQLHYAQVQLEKAISTNKKVNLPSDSPGFAATILDSRRSLREIIQYNNNLDAANTWLTASESAMNSMVERLNRARVVAEQMATGTYQPQEHASAAAEVENILAQIITLANSRIEGSYIFGGTRSELPPITRLLMADNAAALTNDSSTGHGSIASTYVSPGTGLSHLQFARDTVGVGNSVSFPVPNTLGASSGYSFAPATWTQVQLATSNQAGIWRTSTGVALPTTVISAEAGEELTWLADPAVGNQTYRTDGVVSVTGAGSVRINGTVYAVVDAADLCNQVNQAASPDYFAHISGNDVCIISKGTGAFNIDLPVGAVTINDDTTLQEVQNDINSGLQATSMFNIDGGAGAFPPAPTDTVSVGNFTWTWEEIAGGAALVTAQDHANALRDWINTQTNDYAATVTASGGGADATVMLSARAAGIAANSVTLGSNNAAVTHSGQFYGGLEGTDTATAGNLYGSGTSTLRLNTKVRAEVLNVDSTSGAVTLRLNWFDDNNLPQTKDVVLTNPGESNALLVPELGDISIYRDNDDFYEGAIFDLELTHFQGNEEDLAINFSQSTRLLYNWSARQLLGDGLRLDLRDEPANRTGGTGAGSVFMDGIYQGLNPRSITYDVIDGGTLPGGNGVTFRVTWTDEGGAEHVEVLNLQGTGRTNGVVIPIMGKTPKVDLTGAIPVADPANTSTGSLTLTGTYTGLTPRDLNFEIISGGTAPDDQITVRATWLDDQGAQQQEDVDLWGTGSGKAVEIPGADGISFYLNPGTYVAGDTFDHSFQMYPDNAGEGIFFYVDNQNFDVGDSFRYEIQKQPLHIMDTLVQWQYMLENGTAEESQTFSQRSLDALNEAIKSLTETVSEAGSRKSRIEVRTQVLEEQNLYASNNLEELQEVDLLQAFMELKAQQTAYGASLKVISVVTDMFLVNFM